MQKRRVLQMQGEILSTCLLLNSPVVAMNRNQASRRLLGAGPPTYANGLSGRCAGRRRREENFARCAGSAGWGHPDCREDGGYDGDGGRGQDRDRADVAQPAAMLRTVVSFLFRGEGVGLRAESGAQQQTPSSRSFARNLPSDDMLKISIPEKKRGPAEGPSFWSLDLGGNLCPNYVLGLQTFWSLLHLELHLRAFIQGTITVRLDRRKVNEYVVAARSLDKSIALGGIKPLHNTFFLHVPIS